VLADPSVDAVYIALHNPAHREWAEAALVHGKHVLCEKPLCDSRAGVEQLIQTSASTGLDVVEALWYLWQPAIQEAQRLVKRRQIGDVLEIKAGLVVPAPGDGNYRWRNDLGGGSLFDLGCYLISAALALQGSIPSEVSAHYEIAVTGVDKQARVRLTWQNASAELLCAFATDARRVSQWLLVRGTQGNLRISPRPFVSALRGVADGEKLVLDGAAVEQIAFAPINAYVRMVEQVSASFQQRPAFVVPLAHSLSVATVLETCRALLPERSGTAGLTR